MAQYAVTTLPSGGERQEQQKVVTQKTSINVTTLPYSSFPVYPKHMSTHHDLR